MILSDKTILERLDTGEIGIEPNPSPEQIQPASLDVRFGGELYDITTDTVYEAEDGVLTIEPDVPYLGYTMDDIDLPKDLAALLTGRSSLGRLFVTVHQTAGWLDPGFSGTITLEIYNFSDEAVDLDVGSRVGQLVFFELDRESTGYDGRYQGQTGIVGSRDR